MTIEKEELTEWERRVFTETINRVSQDKPALTLNEVEEIKEEALAESVVAEHGLLNAKGEDIQDEMQFLGTDQAENLDEEEESVFAVSPELQHAFGGKR
tara:strand:- start:2498 stop:2794 length:297 start_codon:yes stop_codon:yes gene_type:complete